MSSFPLPACPDRCGGRAEWQGIEADGATRYRCSRCGEVWWTPAPTLFDPDEGARLRDQGMARAAGAQGEDWKAWAREAIERLARSGQLFTADTLYLLAADEGRQPAHRNAIGAAFRAAAQAGVIVTDGTTQQTSQTAGHRRRQLVWRGART